MAKLIYVSNVSLDGFIEDEHGSFEWTAPSDEHFAFITDLVRPVGTHLYGRRLYETMAVWETDPPWPPNRSSRLTSHTSGRRRTRSSTPQPWMLSRPPRVELERRFDPDSIRGMKAGASRDLMVGGSNLAAQAFRAGLVDECHLFIYPVVLGRGKPSLSSELRVQLELLDVRRFDSGVVYVRYGIPI